jgi:hypothetical protein
MIGRSSTPDWDVATQGHKWMYRDLDLSGFVDRDGSHVLDVKNVSTSPVRNLTVHKATTGDRYVVKELAAGASVPVPIGKDVPVDHTRRATFFLRYTTHHGLPHNTFDEIAFRAR